jgi:hypothetical protein
MPGMPADRGMEFFVTGDTVLVGAGWPLRIPNILNLNCRPWAEDINNFEHMIRTARLDSDLFNFRVRVTRY